MPEITRRLEFDAGHRVLKHESKCANLHGHRYAIEITLHKPGLDSIGRVLDFGEIKRILQQWIDDNWDHNILLHPEDPLTRLWMEFEDSDENPSAEAMLAHSVFNGKKPYIMKNGNPTAEIMAYEFLHVAKHLLSEFHTVAVQRVRLYETPNCWADCF